ncbi:hypothetical protein AVEN_152197-1 [Araneus ventricosus]|uniref:Integrase catalytic domain-containing protein n=1 Tax=Araneus ventricosus TaxID=182803 RepID=A0A4Y2HL74_ARAVE|nr:hypothetical protein AVEN_152197-1 [Araneus ventricosus]
MYQERICTPFPKLNDSELLNESKEHGIFVSDASMSESYCLFEREPNEIHILLGADVIGNLLKGEEVKHLRGGLVAVNTHLGRTVMGKLKVEKEKHSNVLLSLYVSDNWIKDLWSLDVIGIKEPCEKKTRIELKEAARDHFARNVSRDEEGRYVVSLPWIQDHPPLLNCKNLAERRLKNCFRSLERSGNLGNYEAVFHSWLDEDIIEEVQKDADTKNEHYLPHHPVYKDNSTTKIRPVFDGSAKEKNSSSINECLEKGPNMAELIPVIINKFRLRKFGITADIEKAFLQIGLREDDKPFLRFLWWENGDKENTKIYQHNRVVFGISSSPFLLGATLEHHLKQVTGHLEVTAQKLLESFYVDNCVTSEDNEEELRRFMIESREILSPAKFNLRVWEHTGVSAGGKSTILEEEKKVPVLGTEIDGTITCQLVQARARVAPIKAITIPRLELLACTVGSRLVNTTKSDLGQEDVPVCCWSDSVHVLNWIKGKENWGTFVYNRVQEIRRLTNPEDWRHIAGILNPADLPSRGFGAEELTESLWWEGPSWLKKPREEWPLSEACPDFAIINSERKRAVASTINSELKELNYLSEISSYEKIIRVTAWIFRFYNNIRKQQNDRDFGDLNTQETDAAERAVLKIVQKQSFLNNAKSLISQMQTLVDSNGVIRIKSQLTMRKDSESLPIALPSKHPIVTKLILGKHLELCHAGVQTVMSTLQEKYWILKSRKTVRRVLGECIICKRFTVRPLTTLTPPLPEDRVREARIFETTGVDLCGPLFLRYGTKSWIVLFTCAVFRAVHLELVTSLFTENFILALRRFISRRGRPSTIYSDNGTNLVGISNELKNIDWKKLKDHGSLKRINWKLNPPSSPWWGGFWERLIGMLKIILRRILGKARLTYEELYTIVCDSESVINSRH